MRAVLSNLLWDSPEGLHTEGSSCILFKLCFYLSKID